MIRTLAILTCAVLALSTSGCIRARNYRNGSRPDLKPTYFYKYSPIAYGCGYFKEGEAHLAFVEFDDRGALYRNKDNKAVQLDEALSLINSLRHPASGGERDIALYVFIHGWKNNASEESGNVWGFRRFLSDIAHQYRGMPVAGIYIGWPGASLKGDKFLSFWNREPVADNVGNGELTDVLRKMLRAAKGENYTGKSVAVVIGHSFGGIVLERVATKLIREQLEKLPVSKEPGKPVTAPAPADLFVLVNEAGAASIARPFLLDLKKEKVEYENCNHQRHPLLLSMTSHGDLATKLAYPGGEFLSPTRDSTVKFDKPDVFGQTSTGPYRLLTAANMPALFSHRIQTENEAGGQCDVRITITDNPVDCVQNTRHAQKHKNAKPRSISSPVVYCMNKIPPPDLEKPDDRNNNTPYWIMQLPQTFVPDHGSVFQDYFLELIRSMLEHSGLTQEGAAGTCPAPPEPTAAAATGVPGTRPGLTRRQ